MDKNDQFLDKINEQELNEKQYQQKLTQLQQKNTDCISKIDRLKRKKDALKNENFDLIEKQRRKSHEYQQALNDNQNLYNELLELQDVNEQMLTSSKQSNLLLRKNTELESAKNNLESNLVEQTKDIDDLEKKLMSSRTIIELESKFNNKLKTDVVKYEEKAREFLAENETIRNKNMQLEAKLEQLNQDMLKYEEETESLRQSLKLEQHRRNNSVIKFNFSRNNSEDISNSPDTQEFLLSSQMQAELDGGSLDVVFETQEEENDVTSSQPIITLTPNAGEMKGRTFTLSSKPPAQLTQCKQFSINIMGRIVQKISDISTDQNKKRHRRAPPCRKPPLEEHFHLLVSAIKLNSPYMDSICTVSVDSLFEQVNTLQIAFQNWHTWIQRQLNHTYLEEYYNPDNVKIRRGSVVTQHKKSQNQLAFLEAQLNKRYERMSVSARFNRNSMP